MRLLRFAFLGLAFTAGCPSTPEPTWEIVGNHLAAALMSVDGTSWHDVWVAGADKGGGPLVLHFNGDAWQRVPTGVTGDLWWVHTFPAGPVFFGGANGLLLRWDGSKMERLLVPALAKQTIYGVWGSSPTDVYAVGGAAGREGFIFHYDGSSFQSIDLPLDIPRLANGEVPGLFKVWGSGDSVWIAGGQGTLLHKVGKAPFTVMPSGTTETLFTIHGSGERIVAVGGGNSGVAIVNGPNGFQNASPTGSGLLQGVYVTADSTWASGEKGGVFSFDKESAHFTSVAHGLALDVQSLHATYVDDKGDVWSVGGNVLGAALDGGAVIHRGSHVPAISLSTSDGGAESDAPPAAVCPDAVIAAGEGKSIARRWDEQILASIRRDLPRPTVHARNLYHLSAAMWDAWAAYDTTAKGVFVREKLTATDALVARNEAISYAAYRVLQNRYSVAIGGDVDVACYRAVMQKLGFDPDDTVATGATPRALGNRIGAAVIGAGDADGANQAKNYADPVPYVAKNDPLIIDNPGATLKDPDKWQPLNLSVSATQNGIVLPAGVQSYIGSHWGSVKPFSITRATDQVPYFDIGAAPVVANVGADIQEVILKSSELDASDAATIDISPGAYGNNTLGMNDGKGRTVNPITSAAYAPNVVLRGDFGRSLAEFWADGPKSETPPGHWNTVANLVADSPSLTRQLFGAGTALDPLSWDVHVYLALNGAVHDAAIAAWDLKRRQESIRPISLIRWMPSQDKLPIVPGLIEKITDASSAPGQPHEHLAHYKGEIAIKAWRGEPCDRTQQVSGAGWIRAVDWMPYQRRSFVTPAFPGFISGHSTFSRAAAEVLSSLTGSPFFPGGFAEYVLPKNTWLSFELGPTVDLHLQWATYYDAADQAGQSRIWGGIHVTADDFGGRKVGHDVGLAAVGLATKYFDGTAN